VLASVERRKDRDSKPKPRKTQLSPARCSSGADVRTLTRPARHILVLLMFFFHKQCSSWTLPCTRTTRRTNEGPPEGHAVSFGALAFLGPLGPSLQSHHVNSRARDQSRQDCWRKCNVVIRTPPISLGCYIKETADLRQATSASSNSTPVRPFTYS
jgi:hypothetical protein